MNNGEPHPTITETHAYLRDEYAELVRRKIRRAYEDLQHDLNRVVAELDAWEKR